MTMNAKGLVYRPQSLPNLSAGNFTVSYTLIPPSIAQSRFTSLSSLAFSVKKVA
jgi:hypothetical protein